jgi:hypothetical protein
MIIRLLAASVFAAAAAGCATMAEPADTSNTTRETAPDGTEYTVVDRTGDGSRCPADAYQVLLGQQASEIDRASLPAPHRVYGVGDAVTMDYRVDRLNIVVGADGRVAEVKCG